MITQSKVKRISEWWGINPIYIHVSEDLEDLRGPTLPVKACLE
jgi:hypothetical protein